MNPSPEDRIERASRSVPRAVARLPATPVAALLAALIVISLALAIGIGDSLAHGGASGVVKERMQAMETMGDHAEAVGDMLKGKRPLEPEAIRTAAAAFVEHGQRIPELFPDNEASREGAKTEALPAIWEEWERFSELASRFVELSGGLATTADALEPGATLADPAARAVKAAFFRTAKNCSGCHERFRVDAD